MNYQEWIRELCILFPNYDYDIHMFSYFNASAVKVKGAAVYLGGELVCSVCTDE